MACWVSATIRIIGGWNLGKRTTIEATIGTPVSFEEIVVPGRRFILKQPLSPHVYRENSIWYCEAQSLGILAFGHSSEEAVHSFLQDFSVVWDAIALAPDDSLTADAIDVKRAFRQIVKGELPG
jgi:hypothetical protein